MKQYASFPPDGYALRNGRWVTAEQALFIDDCEEAAEAMRLRAPKTLRQIVGEGLTMAAIVGLFLLSIYAVSAK